MPLKARFPVGKPQKPRVGSTISPNNTTAQITRRLAERKMKTIFRPVKVKLTTVKAPKYGPGNAHWNRRASK